MSKRFAWLCTLVVTLSILLAACGDTVTTTPTLSGAAIATPTLSAKVASYTKSTLVTLSDAMLNSFEDRIQNSKLKNAKIDAYKSSNDLKHIESDLSAGFKGNGWKDETETLSTVDAASLMAYSLSSLGSYLVFTSNNSQVASVILTQGLALNGSISGVSDKDILILEFSGDMGQQQ